MKQKNYLEFLNALSENNQKEWMEANKNWFHAVRAGFLEDVGTVLSKISAWEQGLASFQPKDCVFRQNRDVRFSPNKMPYKINLSAYFSLGGKKSKGPGYYMHIQPGASFLAAGIWMPEADVLKKVRQEIDYSGAALDEILNTNNFNQKFSLPGAQLKTTPKGYAADHPYIHLLKFKSYEITYPVSDALINDHFFEQIVPEIFEELKPFHDFLKSAVEDHEDGSDLL
jgi:uncharacterized protein (TIGR02453 family)